MLLENLTQLAVVQDGLAFLLAHNVTPHDFIVIGILIVLEGVLSADNAVALAAMTKSLPTYEEQTKALNWSIIGSYVLRIVGVFFAAALIQNLGFRALGGAYLLGLAIKHWIFTAHKENKKKEKPPGNFWVVLLLLAGTDFAFSIDSIAASVAVTHKVWVIITGALIGIALLRVAASWFITALEIYPRLEHAAYIMIGFVGMRMLFEVMQDMPDYFQNFVSSSLEFPEWSLYVVMVLAFSYGFSKRINPENHTELDAA